MTKWLKNKETYVYITWVDRGTRAYCSFCALVTSKAAYYQMYTFLSLTILNRFFKEQEYLRPGITKVHGSTNHVRFIAVFVKQFSILDLVIS